MEALTVPSTVSPTSQLHAIAEASQVGGARRAAVALGNTLGLDADAVGRLAIVVTEASTNILRHAGQGQIVMRPFGNGAPGVEVLAIDKGPGILDIARAMRDGFSTFGSAGEGLGGMKRLSETFEIYSQRGEGTVVLARITDGVRVPGDKRAATLDDRVGAISVPIRGEAECGDAWRLVASRRQLAILLVDGLGHGAAAASVAAIAMVAFGRVAEEEPEAVVTSLDRATRGSRGAAASVVLIDQEAGQLRFCGVGNVDGRVLDQQNTAHLVPQNGIVGHALPTLRPTVTAWRAGSRLVLHSDGISARWRADAYPGLAAMHPSLLAGVLFRDFARQRDDVTVLVVDEADPLSRTVA